MEACNVLDKNTTHAQLTTFALRHELEKVAVGDSKKTRINGIIQYLISSGIEQKKRDQIVLEIIEVELNMLRAFAENWGPWEDEYPNFENKYPDLYDALSQDGLTVTDFKLQPQLPDLVDAKREQNEIFLLLDKYRFYTSKGHLEQAIDSHANSNWAAANAQLRTYAEDLFSEMAKSIYGGSHVQNLSSSDKRNLLAKTTPPLFDKTLNEWDGQGKGFINQFINRLNPQGSHPGLSDREDSLFRLQLVLVTTSYYLRKFDRGGIIP